ncbi:hypothetical protein ACSZNX_03755 [Aeromonas veronii]|uniref:hypothetical protein n=1 Tax=Aeromonas veronii TaxID=654 RepID=UPI003EC64ED1
MEVQNLQQQVPVYHVCQQCNGAGCQACSDLLILDGDIQLDPEWNDDLPQHTVEEQLEWLDAFSERVQLLTKMAPINGVIGTTPDYPLSNQMTVRSLTPGLKYDIRFDDRNMYQRREDDLRLAGEWEV